MVDVTGAGDSVCGSLLYNYVSGDDIITAAIGTLRPVDRTEWAFAFLPPQFTMAELKTV